MNGGYIMVNGSGLDLAAESAQTIEGIYSQVDTAYKTGKPVYIYGCVSGSAAVSPIAIMLLQTNETTYTATAGTQQLVITDADAVTVSNLVS